MSAREAVRQANLNGLTPCQRAVLRAIAESIDIEGIPNPSVQSLADVTGFSSRSVRRAIDVLDGLYLTVERQPGREHVYRLTLDTVSTPLDTVSTPLDTVTQVRVSTPPDTVSAPVDTTTQDKEKRGEETTSSPTSPEGLSGQEAKDFERFIRAYPKDGVAGSIRSRAEALAAWHEVEIPSIEVVLEALKADAQLWANDKREEQYKPFPSTWLRRTPWMKLRLAAVTPPPSWGVDNNMKYIPYGDMAL